ncbi:MAG TPA: hypothetical protein VK968_02185, partial [Roseimicrobium sp.]|nr:hypothetical protein [Roseimicrobium sp.]
MVTEYSYTNSVVPGSGDTGLIDAVTPRRIVRYVSGQGFTNSLVYRVVLKGETRDITATTPGAAWNNPSNLVTITKTFTNGPFKGELDSVQYPDGRLELHDYTTNALGTLRTNTVWSGESNAGATEIVRGSKSVQVVDLSGQEQSLASYDIESGKLVGFVAYSQFDELNRPQKISHLDGSFETRTYACCGLETSVDRFGIATLFTYDELKRVTGTTRAGITQITRYNAAGDVTSEVRQGTDGSQVTLMRNGYDRAGRLSATTNAAGAVTTFTTQYDASGQTVRNTTTAVGTAYEGTRVETSVRDGSLVKVTGTAVHGVRYLRNGLIQRSIPLDAAGNDTLEWTETETDIAGRSVATRTSLSATDFAETRSFYNTKGRMIRQVLPDGIVRLFAYNSVGEVEYGVLDMDRDGVIDFDGTDRITQTVSDVVASHGFDVIRSRTYVWPTNSVDSRLLVSTSERSVDGLRSWFASFGLTNQTRLTYSTNSTWHASSIAPNGSYSVSQYQNGYLLNVVTRDASGVQTLRVD